MLNFRHLYHFWLVAREGSMAAASQVLDLTPQTLSSQIAALEAEVGGLLFRREGRGLKLTDLGLKVQRHADEIFTAAEALEQSLQVAHESRPLGLALGISASIHKLIAWRLLEPALQLQREVNLLCETGRTEYLLAQLRKRELDLVLSDHPPVLTPDSGLRLHDLGSSAMMLFAAPHLAQKLRPDFPHQLNNQPFLVNAVDAPYVSELMQWFSDQGIKVAVKAQVDDSALIKVFGHHGMGFFAAPAVIADEVCRQYEVEVVGEISTVRDRLFAITRSSHLYHPAVAAICAGHV
ncbi:LysR family transcriptional regulator [Nitrincola tapanii]|uniref:LysR family transcriptional regulator n=1 Tax=Nitrincola tapanii TaxID=1708751 RepID=A0A5A9W5I1_9GAMM|nr:LysR family transcriptional regulator [Nitrincola tapanii]KAA0875912.1 LysR family transcriptional regulator [Nitrincola tapanii]